ncbi:unnamed protein product [Effrenium voratum]|nr:unnamed protein product [Effrenium voratum]
MMVVVSVVSWSLFFFGGPPKNDKGSLVSTALQVRGQREPCAQRSRGGFCEVHAARDTAYAVSHSAGATSFEAATSAGRPALLAATARGIRRGSKRSCGVPAKPALGTVNGAGLKPKRSSCEATGASQRT